MYGYVSVRTDELLDQVSLVNSRVNDPVCCRSLVRVKGLLAEYVESIAC